MNIYAGSDHRGFTLKNKLIEWLQTKQYHVFDCGNKHHDPNDDWNDFALEVVKHVIAEPDSIGLLLCGSGVGMSIAANRYKGIRAAVCFGPEQAKHARVADHANIISLPAEYITEDTAKVIVKAFIEAQPSEAERYIRRMKKLDM